MSEGIVVALIGGIFSLLTAVVTIYLQGRSGPRQPREASPGAATTSSPGASIRRSSAGHIITACFISTLIFAGVTLLEYIIQTATDLDRNLANLLLLAGTGMLLLLFAWGDSAFALGTRQAAVQLKIFALYAGIKVALILQYRQECLSGRQYREWFCPNMGISAYVDFITQGWMLWLLLAVIGGLALEVMRWKRGP